jgi:hypothetical protein
MRYQTTLLNMWICIVDLSLATPSAWAWVRDTAYELYSWWGESWQTQLDGLVRGIQRFGMEENDRQQHWMETIGVNEDTVCRMVLF